MANTHYYEQLADERTERTRQMLLDLPVACTDFINSITMTTSPLTRMAYTIDLARFANTPARKSPTLQIKCRENGLMMISHKFLQKIFAGILIILPFT